MHKKHDFAIRTIDGLALRDGLSTLADAKRFVEESDFYRNSGASVSERMRGEYGITSVIVALYFDRIWWKPVAG